MNANSARPIVAVHESACGIADIPAGPPNVRFRAAELAALAPGVLVSGTGTATVAPSAAESQVTLFRVLPKAGTGSSPILNGWVCIVINEALEAFRERTPNSPRRGLPRP
jgi:hypothetical protein